MSLAISARAQLENALACRVAGDDIAIALHDADLSGQDLVRANLKQAQLTSCRLDGACMAGAKLTRADLSASSLVGAELNAADLSGAVLSGADLKGAKLEGAMLTGADLTGARLSHVLGEPLSLRGARIDSTMAKRSGLSDDDVLMLWRAGARIVDIPKFSERVATLCRPPSYSHVVTRSTSGAEQPARPQRDTAEYAPTPQQRRRVQEVRKSVHSDAPPMSERPTQAMLKPLSEGDTVLGAVLQELHGEGVTCDTWLAHLDDDAGGRQVAIKQVRSDGDDAAARQAFKRGLRVMQRLNEHPDRPSTITALLAHEPSELVFMTPWYPQGSAEHLPALQWEPKRIVSFMTKVCQAVSYAHQQGVLHRCIKPSNLLLDDNLDPVLIDFDLVDLQTYADDPMDPGSYPQYAAPEELAGEGTQSPTADIFSLGRLLQYFLSGKHPNEPPSNAPLLPDLDGTSAALVRIVRKCTMRDPRLRYEQVTELIEALTQSSNPASPRSTRISRKMLARRRISSLPRQRYWLNEAPPSSDSRHRSTEPPGSWRGRSDLPPSSSRFSDEPPSSRRARGPASSRFSDEPPSSRRGRGPASSRFSDEPPSSRRGHAPPSSRSGRSLGPPSSRRGLSVHPGAPSSRRAAASSRREAPWLSRRTELIIVAAGALLLVFGLAWLLTAPIPDAARINISGWSVAIGLAAVTFAIPPMQLSNVRRARLLSSLAAVTLIFIIGLEPLAQLRLEHTLKAGSPDERGAAVGQLSTHGRHDFAGLDLSGSQLGAIDLGNADLSGARLDQANLSGAALMEADLRGASVAGAIITGADLSNSTFAEAQGWAQTVCDTETDMPKGWQCKGEHPARANAAAAPGQAPGQPGQAANKAAEGPLVPGLSF